MNFKRILIGIVLFSIVSAAAGADWNMFRHDLNHSGYTPEAGPALNNTLWSFTTGDLIFSSPAVADGMVFFGSIDHKLYALNASPLSMSDKKRLIWNFTTDKFIYSSPAVSGGMVFFGAVKMISGSYLNETTGQWASCGSLTPERCSAMPDWCGWNTTAGCVPNYIHTYTSIIYAVNEFSGEHIWDFSTGRSTGLESYSSPSVAEGMVFFGSAAVSSRGRVYAFNASTGELRWNYTIDGRSVGSSPAVSDGIVFIGSDMFYLDQTVTAPGRIYALNISTGELMWNYSAQSLCTTLGDETGVGETYPCSIFSSPAVFGGMVFFGSNDNYIYALNKSNGNLIWNYSTNDDVRSSPAVAYGKIFIGSMDGKVYALNMSNGNPVWNYSIGANVEIVSSPAVAGHIVYIGGGNNNVYAFNESTGQLLWVYSTTGEYVDSSPAVVSGAENGILFIGSMDNKLYAIGTVSPDLVIGNVSIPSGIKDGQVTLINATLRNPGEGDAGFKVSFYYDLIGPAYLIGEVSGSIVHFGEENVSVSWDTAGKAGNHTIYAIAVVTSNVGDKNESNNIAVKSIQVGIADRSLRIIPHYNKVNFGSDFTVSLNISSDIFINGTAFNLLFNSTILNLTTINGGSFFNPVNYGNYSSAAGGMQNVTLNFMSGNSVNGTGILAEITFNAKGTGFSALNLENVNFYDDSGIVPGVLAVGGEVKVCIAGDVDCDCTVDVSDLMLVARSFHTKPGDLTYDSRADLNNDNVINVFDLSIVGKNY